MCGRGSAPAGEAAPAGSLGDTIERHVDSGAVRGIWGGSSWTTCATFPDACFFVLQMFDDDIDHDTVQVDDDIDHDLVQVDIGEWGEHAEAIGTRFRKGDAASRDDAQGIMRALGVTKCEDTCVFAQGPDAPSRRGRFQTAPLTRDAHRSCRAWERGAAGASFQKVWR